MYTTISTKVTQAINCHQGRKNKKARASGYLGRNLTSTSPSPVPAAAPTSLSTYAPAPGIGVSPTRLNWKEIKVYNLHKDIKMDDKKGIVRSIQGEDEGAILERSKPRV